jgi:hypothetical protein
MGCPVSFCGKSTNFDTIFNKAYAAHAVPLSCLPGGLLGVYLHPFRAFYRRHRSSSIAEPLKQVESSR